MERKFEVLEFIIAYHLEYDKPPSYRAISKEFGFAVGTAFVIVRKLKEEGYIKKETIAKGISTKYDK